MTVSAPTIFDAIAADPQPLPRSKIRLPRKCVGFSNMNLKLKSLKKLCQNLSCVTIFQYINEMSPAFLTKPTTY